MDASTAPSVEANEATWSSWKAASADGAAEASKPRRRHWENRGQPGQLVFVTTKCLDWAPIFADPMLSDRMVKLLFQIHAFHRADLHAFVVMPEHLHFISRLPNNQTDQQFVGKLKSYSEDQLHPLISYWQEKQFDHQRGLNRRYFWARSFRSISVLTHVFWKQKLYYTHWNPVRRELCAKPEQYPWSSARLFAEGKYRSENGLMDLWPYLDASTAPPVEANGATWPSLKEASADGAAEASNSRGDIDASTAPSVEANGAAWPGLKKASADGAAEASDLWIKRWENL